MHLVSMHHRVRQFRPDVIVVDPVSNLVTVGTAGETKAMLTRLIDFLKGLHVTALFTSLSATEMEDQTDVGVSSLMDTWLLLRNLESNGERNRALYILKSRGSRHSNQVREFVLSNRGIQLVDVYTGTGTVLTGSARLAQETREKAETTVRQQNIARFQRQIALERQTAEARIAAMRAETEARIEALIQQVSEATLAEQAIAQDRERLGTRRMAGRDGAPERTPRATKNQKDRL
jgi:circadian clock protein KaiC